MFKKQSAPVMSAAEAVQKVIRHALDMEPSTAQTLVDNLNGALPNMDERRESAVKMFSTLLKAIATRESLLTAVKALDGEASKSFREDDPKDLAQRIFRSALGIAVKGSNLASTSKGEYLGALLHAIALTYTDGQIDRANFPEEEIKNLIDFTSRGLATMAINKAFNEHQRSGNGRSRDSLENEIYVVRECRLAAEALGMESQIQQLDRVINAYEQLPARVIDFKQERLPKLQSFFPRIKPGSRGPMDTP